MGDRGFADSSREPHFTLLPEIHSQFYRHLQQTGVSSCILVHRCVSVKLGLSANTMIPIQAILTGASVSNMDVNAHHHTLPSLMCSYR